MLFWSLKNDDPHLAQDLCFDGSICLENLWLTNAADVFLGSADMGTHTHLLPWQGAISALLWLAGFGYMFPRSFWGCDLPSEVPVSSCRVLSFPVWIRGGYCPPQLSL